MIVLRDSTETLTITLGGSNAHEWHTSYLQYGPGGAGPDRKADSGSIATTAATAICTPAGGPAEVRSIHIRNTTGNTTTVHVESLISGGTARSLTPAISLASGESLGYESGSGWQVYLTNGNRKAAA